MKVSTGSAPAVEERPAATAATRNSWLNKSLSGVMDPWLWANIVVIFVIVFISYALTFQQLGRDEGAFAVIAHGIVQGKLPYRDYFDQQGPAIYYLLAGILLIAHGLNPFQQADLMLLSADIANTITAIGLVILGKKLWRIEIGVLAAALWLISLPSYGGNWFVTEPYMVTFAVFSAVVVAREGTSVSRTQTASPILQDRLPLLWRGLIAGILLAVSSMFKQTAILEFPGIIILLSMHTSDGNRRVGAWFACAMGFCAAWFLVCVTFAAQGALQPLINDVVWANLYQYPSEGQSTLILGAMRYADRLPLLWIFPLLMVGALCLYAVRDKRLPDPAITALYVLAAAGAEPLLFHDYPQYWLQLLPWVCMLCSVGIFWVIGKLREQGPVTTTNTHRAIAAGALLGLVIGLSATQNLIMTRIPNAQIGLADQMAVVSWINQNVPRDKTLLIGPANPEYYFLSGRMPSTNYVYLLPVDSSLYPEAESEVQSGEFHYILWNTGYGGTGSLYAMIYNAILARYRPISSNPASGFVLYIVKS
ncbi:MAG: hypothetical protein ACLQUY_01875 [Ktedonobacterales bacterium]